MMRNALQRAWMPGVAAVLLTFVAIYGSWAVAYMQLGRRPQPLVDDPRSIGGLSADVYALCLWIVNGLSAVWFISTILTIVGGVLSRTEQRGGGLLALSSFVGLSLLLFGSYVEVNAISWFFD